MKKSSVLLILAAAVMAVFLLLASSSDSGNYLRIHIRANSNLSVDQSVKYQVKEAVVSYLTPYLAACKDKKSAMATVKQHLKALENTANSVLSKNNFSYTAKASLKSESFPARNYGEFTLADGVYDALILELGTGEGDNWWCVVYPPLCFVGGTDNGSTEIKYKSLLLEIIEDFKEKYLNGQ